MKNKQISEELLAEVKNCIMNATHQVPFLMVYNLLQRLDNLDGIDSE